MDIICMLSLDPEVDPKKFFYLSNVQANFEKIHLSTGFSCVDRFLLPLYIFFFFFF